MSPADDSRPTDATPASGQTGHNAGTQRAVAQAVAASTTDAPTPGPTEFAPPEKSGAASDDTAKPKRDRHLHQIDFVRLVTFAGVILDHVMIGAAGPANVAANGVEVFLRYTRYGFFALTGFVLTYQYRKRPLHPIEFWRRRYKLIGLPFLVWSLFYWTYDHYVGGGLSNIVDAFRGLDAIELSAKSLVYDLITGTASYHLYFLSVSMQIYAVFPLALWVLRRTWGYHRYLLAASFGFHSLLLYLMVRPPLGFLTGGLPGLVWRHLEITLLPYQFFILAGAIAAMHFEAFQAFAIRWRWYVLGVGTVVIAATLLYFLHVVDAGEPMFRATNVFMLHNSFAYIAIIMMLYCLGTLWQQRRSSGSVADRFMRSAADRSFAVYLVHALALAVVESSVISRWDILIGPKIVVIFAATVALTVFIVEALRRSPISLITTGRSTIDWRTQSPAWSAGAGVVAVGLGVGCRVGDEQLLGTTLIGAGAIFLVSAAVVFARRRAETGAEIRQAG